MSQNENDDFFYFFFYKKNSQGHKLIVYDNHQSMLKIFCNISIIHYTRNQAQKFMLLNLLSFFGGGGGEGESQCLSFHLQQNTFTPNYWKSNDSLSVYLYFVALSSEWGESPVCQPQPQHKNKSPHQTLTESEQKWRPPCRQERNEHAPEYSRFSLGAGGWDRHCSQGCHIMAGQVGEHRESY